MACFEEFFDVTMCLSNEILAIPIDRLQSMQLFILQLYVDGDMQDCSNSSSLAMELLQPCIKPCSKL